jgi:hypothetical protein
MTTSINWSNVTDLSQVPGLANDVSGGSFWVGMLYMIWIILIMLMMAYGFEVAIVVASFVSLVFGLLLVYAGLVAWGWVSVFAGVLILMFFYIIYSGSKT